MLDTGEPAPDFDLDGTDGDRVGTYRLSAAAGQAPVLIAFYTANFEPRCTRYLAALRDTDWGDLTDAIAVFGVAPGSVDAHRRFATELGVPFPLLVDDPGVDGQFGVQRPDGSTQRAAVLVDRRCRVEFAWADAEPDRETGVPDIDPVLSAVARL